MTDTKKKKPSWFRRVRNMHKSMTKPTGKQWFKGTAGVMVGAIVAAVCVSAVDSVFTAMIGWVLSYL